MLNKTIFFIDGMLIIKLIKEKEHETPVLYN